MPDITIIHIALLAAALLFGLVVGWVFRSRRSQAEKMAINAGWQEQLEAQRSEHDRLVEQNRMLMQQNSQYQASNKDSKMRAAELSASLKEAFARRDELQRQIKDIRGNLETAVEARNQLQSDIANREAEVDVTSVALKQRDDRIARLHKELANWQERVPPLIERFRVRNEEAQQLEQQLTAAQDRIEALESMLGSEQTRVEPVDRSALGDDLSASNEPLAADMDETAAYTDEAAAQDPSSAAVAEDVDAESLEAVVDEQDEVEAPAGQDEAMIATDDDPSDERDEPPAAEAVSGDADDVDEEHAHADDDADPPDHDRAASEDFGAGDAADNDSWDADDDTGADDPASASVYAFTPATNGRKRDNLKLIKGVGPAIEKTLNEMGIWRFHQIAEMSEYEIDRVARRLKGFRSRIYREDWIGQARDLDQRKTADQN